MEPFIRCTKTLMLISVLLSMLLITMTVSNPITYTTYDGRELSSDHPKVVLLVDYKMPELENEMFDSSNDPGSSVVRTKRIGSLSIVNSLDVLRDRVLLELARRKALQEQRQIDANRRFFETIGKRSLPTYNEDASKTSNSRTRNGIDYAIEQQEKNYDQSVPPERIPEKAQEWFEAGDPVFRDNHDSQIRRVQTNGLHLL